jgi:mercuric ion binding protein
MKTQKSILFLVIAFIVSALTFHLTAQPMHNETATFKVYGNCGMCKNRIESALKENGVSNAVWDVKTKMLTVTYNPHIISLDQINKKIAAVGHDTETVKADDKTYKNLMGCCQYERKK